MVVLKLLRAARIVFVSSENKITFLLIQFWLYKIKELYLMLIMTSCGSVIILDSSSG